MWVLNAGAVMSEVEDRIEYEGKALFIIRNGKKIAKHEDGKLPGVVVRPTPEGIKIEMPH